MAELQLTFQWLISWDLRGGKKIFASMEFYALRKRQATLWALGVPATPSLGRLILRGTVVCSIAAGPSFFSDYDVSKQQTTAMSLGVLIFIAFYVMADFKFTRDRLMR